jgi:murein DD-endopeptidase MepM/ murein hydrolase activator NlpD
MKTKNKTSAFFFAVSFALVPSCLIMLMSFGKKQQEERELPAIVQNQVTENIPAIAPVDFGKVTKVVLYGEVIDPETNKTKNHTGIDFQLSAGSDVVATADGVVASQSYGEKPGNFVVIRHNPTFSTRYYHFSKTLVKAGDRVTKGQVIGLVGNTGLSTISHLHYEVLKNNTPVDPKGYLPVLPGS